MRITVASRLKPYSHQPGTRCLIPGSRLAVEVFPNLIRIYDLSNSQPILGYEQQLGVKGPVSGFTVQQDLEQGVVKVWGKGQNGYFRYLIANAGEGVSFKVEKACEGMLLESTLKQVPVTKLDQERLSLGCHKAQDWVRMSERSQMEEIFPFWLRLGQLTPETGECKALVACRQHIQDKNASQLTAAFRDVYQGLFRDLFFPLNEDDLYQGFSFPRMTNDSSAGLLSDGASLIRRLFVQVEGNYVTLLPLLPTDFPCGRMVNILLPGIGRLDIEWRKRTLRRMVLHASHTTTCQFQFPKSCRKFRLQEGKEVLSPTENLSTMEGSAYLFDRFSS